MDISNVWLSTRLIREIFMHLKMGICRLKILGISRVCNRFLNIALDITYHDPFNEMYGYFVCDRALSQFGHTYDCPEFWINLRLCKSHVIYS